MPNKAHHQYNHQILSPHSTIVGLVWLFTLTVVSIPVSAHISQQIHPLLGILLLVTVLSYVIAYRAVREERDAE